MLRSEGPMSQALRQGQLAVHFQPIVAHGSGRVVGAEALLRRSRPGRPVGGPHELLADAERTGAMGVLDAWVIDAAIAERSRWPDELFVSINIAPSQLGDDTVLHLLEAACCRYGVDLADVCIEVTEARIEHSDPVRRTLQALADRGVRIALDDFGAGETSLARLIGMPFQVCKLDRSLTQGPEDRSRITRAIIDLAHALGMTVVAEGIEDATHGDRLTELGADLGQGFGLARPMPGDRFRALLDSYDRCRLPDTPRPALHRVVLYEDDLDHLRRLAVEFADVLRRDEQVVAVTTAAHAQGLRDAMRANGWDVAVAEQDGQLAFLDADELLDALLVDGHIPFARFQNRIQPALAAMLGTGRPVTVFGEVVARLWQRGEFTAALELESHWNDASFDHRFSIICAYPLETVGTPRDPADFDAMCQAHSQVMPAEPFGDTLDRDAQRRAVARLQREAASIATWRSGDRTTAHELHAAVAIVGDAVAALARDRHGDQHPEVAIARIALGRIARSADRLGADDASVRTAP